MTSSAKELYNTQFVVNYHELDDIYLTVHMWNKPQIKWLHTGSIKLKRKHCSFLDLLRIINETKYHQEDDDRSFDISIILDYWAIKIVCETKNNSVAIGFSDKLMKLFSLTQHAWEFLEWNKWQTHKTFITQPPVIIDKSVVLFTPVMDDMWIKINGIKLEIPKLYWTYDTFKKAVPIIFKDIFPDFIVRFTRIRDFEYDL